MKDVSIIIVNYNTCKMTFECICSVFENTQNVDYEVILVDNASSDGSKEFFERDNRITYIYSSENLGFGRANNLGAESSHGKYLFLLNSDTLVKNNAVKIFYDYMEKVSDDIGCCGCMLQDRSGKFIHSYGDRHTFSNSLYEWIVYPITHKLGIEKELKKYFNPMVSDYPVEVGFVTGADVFLRRKVYEECGLFDSDFFMYYEDAEMARRWQKAGYKNMIIKGPEIIHLVGGSRSKSRLKRASMIMKSMFLYFEKDRGEFQSLWFKRFFKFSYIISFFLLFPVQRGSRHDKIEHIKDIIRL